MAEDNNENARPLVERWLEEQQEWQRTMLRYMDTMANNEEFLVHLGNAMRGSLLAGKPYPGTAPSQTDTENPGAGAEAQPGDDRLDRILFALHEIQGQLNDLQLTVESLVAGRAAAPRSEPGDPSDGGSNVDGGGHAQGSDNDGDQTSGTSEAHSTAPDPGTHAPARYARVARKVGSGAAASKLRRPQPRGGFVRLGGGAD
jgi:hypothetical protein